MRISKKKFTVLLVILLVATIQTARHFFGRDKLFQTIQGANPKSKGNPRAPIRVVEYTDFQCPACANGSAHLKEFLAKYSNQIFVQYKPFPMTKLHERGMITAVAGECAAQQDKFWPFQDILFTRARLLEQTLRIEGKLTEIATEIGMDAKRFDQCLRNPDTELFIMDEKRKAESLGVRATPTYFINGKMIVGAGDFQQEMQKLLGVAVPTTK